MNIRQYRDHLTIDDHIAIPIYRAKSYIPWTILHPKQKSQLQPRKPNVFTLRCKSVVGFILSNRVLFVRSTN